MEVSVDFLWRQIAKKGIGIAFGFVTDRAYKAGETNGDLKYCLKNRYGIDIRRLPPSYAYTMASLWFSEKAKAKNLCDDKDSLHEISESITLILATETAIFCLGQEKAAICNGEEAFIVDKIVQMIIDGYQGLNGCEFAYTLYISAEQNNMIGTRFRVHIDKKLVALGNQPLFI